MATTLPWLPANEPHPDILKRCVQLCELEVLVQSATYTYTKPDGSLIEEVVETNVHEIYFDATTNTFYSKVLSSRGSCWSGYTLPVE